MVLFWFGVQLIGQPTACREVPKALSCSFSGLHVLLKGPRLETACDDLQPTSDGLQPSSGGLQPSSHYRTLGLANMLSSMDGGQIQRAKPGGFEDPPFCCVSQCVSSTSKKCAKDLGEPDNQTPTVWATRRGKFLACVPTSTNAIRSTVICLQ